MHQWQSVYENTLNALNYKLFKCYRYPVGSVRIHSHHKRMVFVIIWKDAEFKYLESLRLIPYRIH